MLAFQQTFTFLKRAVLLPASCFCQGGWSLNIDLVIMVTAVITAVVTVTVVLTVVVLVLVTSHPKVEDMSPAGTAGIGKKSFTSVLGKG
jgi:hypothetical protein